ncbi:MAG TPA: S6e family ribosomal protein [Candidatus Nanoarchaeia archaeon]|nr:S6e family ribosomal protein [Candidatus Nanoarchaeia archaeon]
MFKLNISEKGKAWKFETEGEALAGKNVGESVNGEEIDSKFEGYEFMITGGSDSAGFPLSKEVEGIALKRVLLTKGWGMRDSRKGVRLRKTVRGKQITSTTSQINLSVVKVGSKKLTELFPEQNKPAEVKTEKAVEVAPTI